MEDFKFRPYMDYDAFCIANGINPRFESDYVYHLFIELERSYIYSKYNG